jgi:hypothetical protein
MITNSNTLTWFSFAALAQAACSIPNNIYEVYVTNDLGLAKESLSFMKLWFTPLNILLAFFSSALTAKTPFVAVRIALILEILLNAYGVFVIAGRFPAKDEISSWTIMHVSAYMLGLNLL